MDKLFRSTLIAALTLTLCAPVALAQADDYTEEPDTVNETWNVVGMTFSPKLLTSKSTKKNAVKATATFQYHGSEIEFTDNYIWEIFCSLSLPGDQPKTIFSQRSTFPVNAEHSATIADGDQVTSTVVVEFDKSLVKNLRRQQMSCSLGYAKPAEYSDLAMGTGQGVTMSYLLKLRGNRWIVKGWDF
jgi:hypothetical protein